MTWLSGGSPPRRCECGSPLYVISIGWLSQRYACLTFECRRFDVDLAARAL